MLGGGGVAVVAAVSVISFAALGAATFVIGRRLFGVGAGVLVALIVMTRPFLVAEMQFCSVDIPFLALVASAGALLVSAERREGLALSLLVLAGLLRPEAWLLAAALAGVCWWRGAGPSRRALVVGALFAPLAWALFDLLVTGDALHSLHGTQDLGQELGRPHSASTAFTAIPRYLEAILGSPLAWAGAVSSLAALWLALDRAALPLAIAALGLLGFLALGVADLPLLYRYMLLPGLALVLLCGFGASAWSIVDASGPLRWGLMALASVVLALGATSGVDDRSDLRAAVSYNRMVHDAQVRLAELVREGAVQRAVRHCDSVAVPGPRVVPELAYRLDRRTSEIVVRDNEKPLTTPAFTPVAGALAAAYTLTPTDRQTLSSDQLRGLALVARNASWAAYGGGGCS